MARRGIQLRVEGERLRFTAPHGAMSSEILSQLKAHKAELISLLRARQQPSDPSASVRIYPPSFVQHRFWTLQQLNPNEGFYNVPFVFSIRGPLRSSLSKRVYPIFNPAPYRRYSTLK